MDEFLRLVAKAAESVGVEAARIWPQIVMITFAQSLFWLIVCTVFLINATVGTFIYVKNVLYYIEKDDETRSAIFIAMVGIALIFGFFAFMSIADHIAGVVSPEAVTVMRIIGKK